MAKRESKIAVLNIVKRSPFRFLVYSSRFIIHRLRLTAKAIIHLLFTLMGVKEANLNEK
jgi:hypothetical protein